MDDKSLGYSLGGLVALILASLNKFSSARRRIKIDNADADAFMRLTKIADRAEKQLAEQAQLFRERIAEVEQEKHFYFEQTQKLTTEVSKLQSLVTNLQSDLQKLNKESRGAA